MMCHYTQLMHNNNNMRPIIIQVAGIGKSYAALCTPHDGRCYHLLEHYTAYADTIAC